MKKLPPINGLLCSIAAKRLQATREATASRSQTKCPRTAYEAGESAGRLAKEADVIEKWVADDADLIVQIEACIAWLAAQTETSTHRELAQHCLESAADRLRREIGDVASAG